MATETQVQIFKDFLLITVDVEEEKGDHWTPPHFETEVVKVEIIDNSGELREISDIIDNYEF